METHVNRVSPQQLYHAVWQAAGAAFYERSRLNGWHYWENRFDHLMRDDADAYRYIGEMLASLRDNYTFLKTPQAVHEDQVALERAPAPVFSRMWANGIGYLHISTFNHNRFCEELFDALGRIDHARGFVIDLRDNKGGFVNAANDAISMFCYTADGMVSRIWENGTYVETESYLSRDGYVAKDFDASGALINTRRWNRWRNLTGTKPIYVLIDESCVSATELFAAMLRDNDRVVLVGRQTWGKGISQNTLNMPNGSGLRITNGVCLPPSRQWFGDDRQTYGDGVRPHIWVDSDPDYRGDRIADVAYEHLLYDLERRDSRNALWALGAFGLGLAVFAGSGGRRRAA